MAEMKVKVSVADLDSFKDMLNLFREMLLDNKVPVQYKKKIFEVVRKHTRPVTSSSARNMTIRRPPEGKFCVTKDQRRCRFLFSEGGHPKCALFRTMLGDPNDNPPLKYEVCDKGGPELVDLIEKMAEISPYTMGEVAYHAEKVLRSMGERYE